MEVRLTSLSFRVTKSALMAEYQKTVSLLGCGWLGIALAPALQAQDFHVRGSTTRASKLSTLSSLGIEPHLLRIEPNENADSSIGNANPFFDSETLIINLPTEAAFGPEYHPGQLRDVLSQLSPKTKHVVYVSSTSVYGLAQGEVDETTTPVPDPGSGEILIESEALLKNAATTQSFDLTIVRAAGLIGPGRHPGLFLAGRKNIRDGHGAVNLIHQADLVALIAALVSKHSEAGVGIRVYNAVAPSHPTREDFYQRVAAAVGVEIPQFAGSSEAESTSRSKIVHGEQIVRDTGVSFIHGDLYSGLGIKK